MGYFLAVADSLTILVVENHRDTLTYLSKSLRRRGYEVREATTLQGAFEEFKRAPAQVVISDVGLPDGDGRQLMPMLKDLGFEPYGISTSGYATDSDLENSLRAGYHHHLVKPFYLADLESTLRIAADVLSSQRQP